jgi:hypothetical protein
MDTRIVEYINRLTTQRALLIAAKNNLVNTDPVLFRAYNCTTGDEIYLPGVTLITGEDPGIPVVTQEYKDALISQLEADIATITAKITAAPCEIETIS